MMESNLPKQEQAIDVLSKDFYNDQVTVTRALGVQWCLEIDQCGLSVNVMDETRTRRNTQAVASLLYDPVGFVESNDDLYPTNDTETTCVTVVNDACHTVCQLMSYASNWYKFCRVVAIFLKLKKNLLDRVKKKVLGLLVILSTQHMYMLFSSLQHCLLAFHERMATCTIHQSKLHPY